MHYFVGFRFPFLGAVHVHPISLRYEFVRAFVREKFEIRERGFASTFSVVVADFVLQDSAKPTAHCRSPAKTVNRPHRGKERLLNQVLRDVGLAYTLEGVAIENVPMLIDPARRIARGCGRSTALNDDFRLVTSDNSRLKRHAGDLLAQAISIVKEKDWVAHASRVLASASSRSRTSPRRSQLGRGGTDTKILSCG